MLKEPVRRVKAAAGSEAFVFRIGFVKTLLYTASKVSFSRQYTPYHLYIDWAC
jgi:hypothetical protein